MSQYTADGKRKSSMTHARRSHVCVCGKVCRGNGGWSSHSRACSQYQAARSAISAIRLRRQAEALQCQVAPQVLLEEHAADGSADNGGKASDGPMPTPPHAQGP